VLKIEFELGGIQREGKDKGYREQCVYACRKREDLCNQMHSHGREIAGVLSVRKHSQSERTKQQD